MSLFALRHSFYRQTEKRLLNLRIVLLRRRHRFVTFGAGSQWIGLPRLQLARDTELQIGTDCIFRSKADSNPIGIDQPVTFCTLIEGARIAIGKNVGISGGSICARLLIEIGDGTLIGANSYIFDNDFHPLDPAARAKDDRSAIRAAPVRIGSNVFIGARTIILKGVTIGDNSIVGAGSIVTQDVPANAVAAGNPCKVLNQRLHPDGN